MRSTAFTRMTLTRLMAVEGLYGLLLGVELTSVELHQPNLCMYNYSYPDESVSAVFSSRDTHRFHAPLTDRKAICKTALIPCLLDVEVLLHAVREEHSYVPTCWHPLDDPGEKQLLCWHALITDSPDRRVCMNCG
ncbi:hypothetical protein DL546_008654 [Coniochaeta pulveracea]|uniref:Secreted protein n=1 Tax=Coniochaeta pulveracea TaxID=177199 RepID=A0A420YDS4_9PEZI|nr:hypothetical protein DL546_008654 [Coniochaeta pulveracea]